MRFILGLSIFFNLVFTLSSYSLTLDDFENGDLEVSTNNIGLLVSNSIASSSAVGGSRTQSIEMTGGNLDMTLEVLLGVLDHSQRSNVTGSSSTVWDGNLTPGITPTGLGGIDLTQDITAADPLTDGLRLDVSFFDNANGAPTDLIITVYSSATQGSFLTKTLNSSINSLQGINFPFNQFNNLPGLMPADFTNIGAIRLFIDGSSPALDLTINWFGTNGCSSQIPVPNGDVFDQCGVCDGNNACLDCAGTPFGNAVVDRCGLCAGDGLSCCEIKEQTDTLRTIDNLGYQLADGVKKMGSTVRRIPVNYEANGIKTKKYNELSENKANEMWIYTWKHPTTSTVCNVIDGSCTPVDISVFSEIYKRDAGEIEAMLNDLFKIIKQTGSTQNLKRARKIKRKFLADKQTAFDLFDTVPKIESECS